MNCINSRGACKFKARYIKRTNSSNFCSYDCYLIYKGLKEPSKPKLRTFDDPTRQKTHDLFIWARTDVCTKWAKSKQRNPQPDEWIVTLNNGAVYLWNVYEREYMKYVLGKGIIDESGNNIIDESSDYYRRIIDSINDVQCNTKSSHLDETDKPTRKRGVKSGAKRGPYKKSKKEHTFICKGCGGTYTQKSKRMKEFCSEACRKRYWRRKKKQKDAEGRSKRKY